MKLTPELLSDGSGTAYLFYCPSCRSHHSFVCRRERGKHTANWQFNGDMERPTFTPSLRIISSRPRPGVPVDNVGGSDMEEYTMCHLFVTDGVIHYCGDTPTAFAGKQVPLEDLTGLGGDE